MATYDLGKVVGDPGEKGDDGSSVWNTSTAPTYANSKYTFTISNLNGKTGIDIAVNDIIFYSTYYYIVSTVNSTTVDCTTRVSIKGSDASVTIVDNLTSDSSTSALSAKQGKALNTNKVATSAIATSWGSTTSDSKVPSEKLTKDSLDAKQATLVSGTNIKTINNNSLLGSGNIDIQSSSVDIATSWGSTLSDTKVPSEKLTKNSLDAKADSSSLATVATTGDYDDLTDKPTIPSDVSDLTDSTGIIPTDVSDLTDTNNTTFTPKSHTHGNLTNDGKVGSNANYFVYTTTSGAITSKQKIGNITTSGAIGSTANKPLITTTNGVITTGSFGTSANSFCEGNDSRLSDARTPTAHTHTVSNITDFPTIPSKISDLTNDSDFIETSSTTGLVKNDGTIDTTVYSTFSGDYDDLTDKPTIPSKISDLTNDSDFIETSSTTGLVKNDGTIDTNTYLTSSSLSNYVQKSSTSGLLKNDGTVDTTSYSTFSGSYNDLSNKPSIPSSSSDLSDGSDLVKTSSTTGLIKNDGTIMTSGTGSSNYSAGDHTHSGYVSGTKVTSWSATVSDSNIPSEKLTKDTLDTKQATLVSGTNIKTINNTSLLGSGDISITSANQNVWYGTSSTSGSTQSKTVSTSNWTWTSGNILFVKFSNTNTHSGSSSTPTQLSIGGTKKAIISGTGSYSLSGYWSSGEIVGFVYDGTDFVLIDDGHATTSNYGVTKLSDSTSSTSTTLGATANAVKTAYDLADSKLSATKVTSWSSTVSDSNVPSEKLVSDTFDAIEDLIGDAITYINQ